MFEQLRLAEQPVAVIDPDELNLVHQDQGRAFWQRNLQVIWPNYAAMGDLRAIIPTVIADAEDHHHLRAALPASRFTICELIAPMATLKQRVWAREPNEHWKRELEKWVDVYHQRNDSQKFGDGGDQLGEALERAFQSRITGRVDFSVRSHGAHGNPQQT